MGYKPVSHDEFEKKAFRRPGVLKAYNELEEEFALIAELIEARKKAGKSQQEVADNMHTTQSVIARIESGFGKKRHSPTLDTLKRYAKAVNCKLRIKLVPCKER